MSAEIHEIGRGSRYVEPSGPAPFPISIEAEQAILGAILMNNECLGRVSYLIREDDFSEEIHRRVFRAASDLIRRGVTATPATLKPFLGDYDLGQGVTVPQYLARLCAAAMPPAVLPGYAQIVHDMAGRRAIIEEAQAIQDRARSVDLREDAALIAAEAMLRLQEVAAASGTDTSKHLTQYTDDLIEMVEGIRDGSIVHETITTGYRDLDQATNGYDPGLLWIVAGRPGMGKSVYTNASAYRAARAGHGVLEFPLEIGPEQAVARHLADMTYRGRERSIAFRDIGRRAKNLSDTDIAAIRHARQSLRNLPIVIDSRSRVTVADVAAKVAQVKRAMASEGEKLSVVFIDHLDFINATDRYRGNRTQEIGEIMIGLKAIARTEQVCIVCMCQLNREVEKRNSDERRPGLSDLRNSGDIEQVADVVAFLYREEYYIRRSPEYLAGSPEAAAALFEAEGKLEMILGKVRAGPTPTINLFCDVASSTISSVDRR